MFWQYSILVALCFTLLRTSSAQSPAGFQPGTTNSLTVFYGQNAVSPAGITLTPAQTQNPPTIGTMNALNGTYMLIMIDIDAPSRTNTSLAQVIHWAQPGYRSASSKNGSYFPLVTTSPGVVSYAGPAPPPGSGSHRYVFSLFSQPANFTNPKSYAGFSAQNRTRFNTTDYVKQARLGPIVVANYYLSENKNASSGNGTSGTSGIGSGNGTAVPFHGDAIETNNSRLSLVVGLVMAIMGTMAT